MSIFNISDENVGKIVSTLYMFIDGKYRKLCDELVDILKKGQINNFYILYAQDEESHTVKGIFTSVENINKFVENTFPNCKKKFTESLYYLYAGEPSWFIFYEVVSSNNIDKLRSGGTITEEQENSRKYREV